jgi:hypothetical protein
MKFKDRPVISTFEVYKKRGGSYKAVAEKWGKTAQAVRKIVSENPEGLMIDFNVFNPASVYRAWIKKQVTVKPERVLFDKRSPDKDEVMG